MRCPSCSRRSNSLRKSLCKITRSTYLWLSLAYVVPTSDTLPVSPSFVGLFAAACLDTARGPQQARQAMQCRKLTPLAEQKGRTIHVYRSSHHCKRGRLGWVQLGSSKCLSGAFANAFL